MVADGLPKEGIELDRGSWIVLEEQDDHHSEYLHEAWFEEYFLVFLCTLVYYFV